MPEPRSDDGLPSFESPRNTDVKVVKDSPRRTAGQMLSGRRDMPPMRRKIQPLPCFARKTNGSRSSFSEIHGPEPVSATCLPQIFRQRPTAPSSAYLDTVRSVPTHPSEIGQGRKIFRSPPSSAA